MSGHTTVLSDLRERITRLEGGAVSTRAALPFGVSAVVHLAAHQFTDLSPMLASLGERGGAFPCRTAVAMNSTTALPATTRATCRPMSCARGTSMCVTFTSTR